MEGSQGCCRVQASLWISRFQDLPITFLVLLLLRCLAQQRWLPQICYWWCCWTAYFPPGLQINWASLAMKLSQPVVQGEYPPWPPRWDGNNPRQESHRLPLFLPWFQQCFMNKCFLTLVDCQIPEIGGFLERSIYSPPSWGCMMILTCIFLKASSFVHLLIYLLVSWNLHWWFVWLSLLPIITTYFFKIKFKHHVLHIGNPDPKFGWNAPPLYVRKLDCTILCGDCVLAWFPIVVWKLLDCRDFCFYILVSISRHLA